MPRYRAEVSKTAVYFVTTETPEDAADKAIALDSARVRPEYILDPTTSVDVVTE
jgi:hypothetical protein